jgi:hypothetical protein
MIGRIGSVGRLGLQGGRLPRAWTPAQLPALALWLDAADTSTITLNGSNVSQWNDKSGNGRHVLQATASQQPSYNATGLNGKPTVVFDGVGDILLNQNAGSLGVTNVSMFMVTRYVTAVSEDLAMGIGQTGQNGKIRAFYRASGRSTQGFGGWSRDVNDSSLSVDIGGVHHIFGIVQPSMTGVNLFRDGTAATGNPYPLTNPATSLEPVNFNGFSIGSLQGASVSSYYSNIEISEAILCYDVLSTLDRQRVEGYLAWKWGTEATLPSTHPYRYAPPVVEEPAWDADALDYIGRVQSAEAQNLELSVRVAIDSFVKGCKADGIWTAIKASCILAGARTLTGALVPLVGTAPTNFNFVAGDYNRKTGLIGDGTTKYLDSNRNNNADPQNSNHQAVFVTTAHSAATSIAYIGAAPGAANGATHFGANLSAVPNQLFFRSRSVSPEVIIGAATSTGFIGMNRSGSASFNYRYAGTAASANIASQTPFSGNVLVFNRVTTSPFSNGRLAFYSVGEALDLALLDARVTQLIAEIGTAIP